MAKHKSAFRSVKRAKSRKRKAPTMTKETIKKILANPKTPKQLKPYWQKRLAALK